MKGIVFNLLEEVIRNEHGEDIWEDILDAAGVEGAYTSLGSYADNELGRIVAAASVHFGLPAAGVVRWFGRQALPLLAERYPNFFEPHSSTLPFILTLNDIIHPEVRKLYPGAGVPEFDFRFVEQDVLVMEYQSDRRLCAFAEGLIEGAALHYGEEVSLTHDECMSRGDSKCSIRITLRSTVTS